MFEKISDKIYIFPYETTTDRPNIGLVIGANHRLIFDAGNSIYHVQQIKMALKEQALGYPDYLAISHWHWDHSFGISAWNLPTIALEKTNQHLMLMRDWKWDDVSMACRIKEGKEILFCSEMIKKEYPDRDQIKIRTADLIFSHSLKIDLGGGVVCHLLHVEAPHSDDSVICYVPDQKVVFLGDSSGKDLYSTVWNCDPLKNNIEQEMNKIPYDICLLKKYFYFLMGLDFDIGICGHKSPMKKEAILQLLEKNIR